MGTFLDMLGPQYLVMHLMQVNIWDYFNKRKSVLLARSNKTLEDQFLQMDQEVSTTLPKIFSFCELISTFQWSFLEWVVVFLAISNAMENMESLFFQYSASFFVITSFVVFLFVLLCFQINFSRYFWMCQMMEVLILDLVQTLGTISLW